MFRAAAIFGQPVSQSRSPLVHGNWLHQHKISGAYLRREVSKQALPALLKNFQTSGLQGASLTLPLKEEACAHVVLDEIAAKLQAVNTIWQDNGKVYGTNTDAPGFMAACDEQVPDWRASLGNVVVLGAGGAAKAVVYALLQAGAERITVINRTKTRADHLQTLFGEKVKGESWDRLYHVLPQAQMLVNTTSLGMKGQPDLELDVKKLQHDAIVADIVYAPLETNLLQEARAAGHKTADGLSMLLHQAVPAFERWFGVRPQVTKDLRALVAADLKGR